MPALLLLAGLAVAYAVTALWPNRYAASASVLMPPSATAGSRILRIEDEAGDPQQALRRVEAQLAVYLQQKARVLDTPVVLARRARFGLNLALGGAGGLALGAGWLLVRRRRRQPVRHERELVNALGAPLLAARPLRAQGVHSLCGQLLAHWLSPQRHLLPVVSAHTGDGRSRVAAQLAVAFAELGHRTLIIDADFRSPGLHRAFGLANRHGLADLLEDRPVSLASAGANLSVMVAGAPGTDPLELLSRQRLPAFLAEACKHFRVVLIDTPAAARGPDFEMFAALAGGALVVTRPDSAEDAALRQLHAALERCGAQLVSAVIHQR